MRANYGKPLRDWIKQYQIAEIVDFGDLPVFQNATTYPCIIRVKSSLNPGLFQVSNVDSLTCTDLTEYVNTNHHLVELSNLDEQGWTLSDQKSQALLKKIKNSGISLGEYVNGKIFRGIVTGFNKAFVIDKTVRDQLINEDPKCADIIKPFLTGRDIRRYELPKSEKYLIYIPWHFPMHNDTTIVGASKLAEIKFKSEFPVIHNHLSKFKEDLLNRNKEETGIRYEWYALQRYGSEYHLEFEKPKIIIPAIVKNASYTFDNNYHYSSDKTSIIPISDLYLLGILNSKVADYIIFAISSTKQGGYYEYKPMYVSQLPIRTINPSDPADVARHDKMVSLIERMLDLNKRLPEARTDQEQTLIKRQVAARRIKKSASWCTNCMGLLMRSGRSWRALDRNSLL